MYNKLNFYKYKFFNLNLFNFYYRIPNLNIKSIKNNNKYNDKNSYINKKIIRFWRKYWKYYQ